MPTLCKKRKGWGTRLALGHARPGGEKILKEWYGLDLIDVRAGGSGLREHGCCLEILHITCRIRRIGRHGQIDLQRQTPADTSYVGSSGCPILAALFAARMGILISARPYKFCPDSRSPTSPPTNIGSAQA